MHVCDCLSVFVCVWSCLNVCSCVCEREIVYMCACACVCVSVCDVRMYVCV